MRTACLIGPKTIELRDSPNPGTDSKGLILKMEACGVCGSDLRRWQEGPPEDAPFLVQGHELAGTVVEAGAEVSHFTKGDRLAVAPDIHCGECWYCRRGLFNLCTDLRLLGITPGYSGGFAECVSLSSEVLANGILHPLPVEVSFQEGALAETISSVLASHDHCRLSLGETVVVLGAGPIGCLHTVLGKARGARVIMAEPNAVRRRNAEQFKPETIVDVTTRDIIAEVNRLTDGLGADVVICANPIASTQTQAVEMARRGGRIVLFGGLPKANPMVSLNANLIHYGEKVVLGAFSYHPSYHEEALRVLARKVVRAEQFITHVLPLSRISEAFRVAASGEALKVMVVPD
ncbi:MAG TPA: alcohol dehydrogenase catalytic domain-containing protein [Verrucomicrobiae bacterium]|nr:alcohol dehydrogenase catalytic domain-containing protein [Verrucomicrobiae bacterium]